MANDLTGQNIQNTYQRVLHVGDDGLMYDGTGSLYTPVSASHEITTETSSSHAISADTASFATNFTASGNISGSATSTGSFGRIEVSSRIEHAQDPNTFINFTSDVVQIKANNIQGAKFASTKTNIGNTAIPTNITGSTIGITGNIISNGTITATHISGIIDGGTFGD